MKGEVCVKKAKEMKKKCIDMEANMCEESKSCEMKGEECVKKAKEEKKRKRSVLTWIQISARKNRNLAKLKMIS